MPTPARPRVADIPPPLSVNAIRLSLNAGNLWNGCWPKPASNLIAIAARLWAVEFALVSARYTFVPSGKPRNVKSGNRGGCRKPRTTVTNREADMAEDKAIPGANSDNGDMGELTVALEKAMAEQAEVKYVLTLYVTGMRPSSQRAIDNIQRLCEEYLPGRHELKIIDIYQQPALAEGAQIIAAPTLVKKLPEPLRRIIGDMSDEGRVLVAMGIKVPEKLEQAAKRSPRTTP